jgi:hypothetical protein
MHGHGVGRSAVWRTARYSGVGRGPGDDTIILPARFF